MQRLVRFIAHENVLIRIQTLPSKPVSLNTKQLLDVTAKQALFVGILSSLYNSLLTIIIYNYKNEY
jgi:hypothetical protein